MYEEFEVTFTDGTTTLVIVGEDEQPADVVIELCEVEGYGLDEVTNIASTGNPFD